jgi:hypothetical protein
MAQTKTMKLAWFTKQGFPESEAEEYLRGISLPDGDRRFGLFGSGPSQQSAIIPAQAVVPPDVTWFFTRFFRNWFLATDYDLFMRGYVDSAAVAMSSGFKSGDLASVARVTLLMWRVGDHGLVTNWGHALPEKGVSMFQALKRVTEQPNALMVREDPYVPLGTAKEPFVILPAGNEYVAITRLRHAPRDSIAVVAGRVGPSESDAWRVVGLTWMVEDHLDDDLHSGLGRHAARRNRFSYSGYAVR